MTNPSLTRYEMQLDVLERGGGRSDCAAAELLRAEFALAINASYFSLLSGGGIAVAVRSREIPQDGVARYRVVLELAERSSRMTHEQAAEVVSRELRRALNASHFRRICENMRVTLVARIPVAAPVGLNCWTGRTARAA